MLRKAPNPCASLGCGGEGAVRRLRAASAPEQQRKRLRQTRLQVVLLLEVTSRLVFVPRSAPLSPVFALTLALLPPRCHGTQIGDTFSQMKDDKAFMSSSDTSFLQRQQGSPTELHVSRVEPHSSTSHSPTQNPNTFCEEQQAKGLPGAERPGDAEGHSPAQPRRNVKYLFICVEMEEGLETVAQDLKSPVLAPRTPVRTGPGNAHRGFLVTLILQIIYS